MKHEYGLEQIIRNPQSVVTVGTFDGVHRGHQAIVRYLVERARQLRGESVVVTFEPHPRSVVQGVEIPLITTLDERKRVLSKLGLDRLVVLEFTKAFSQLSSTAFVESVLLDRIGLKEIVIGHDHAFGRNREGNKETLEALSNEHGFSVHSIPAQLVSAQVVSSTVIRRTLAEEGDVAEAADLLGRYYSLEGTVVHGDARGRQLGYPTANLHLVHEAQLVPRDGVYAVRVTRLSSGSVYGGMMNIGVRPTVTEGRKRMLEVNLFEFEGDLYGEWLRVDFIERIRDEVRFPSLEALIEQLRRDHEQSSQVIGAVNLRAG